MQEQRANAPGGANGFPFQRRIEFIQGNFDAELRYRRQRHIPDFDFEKAEKGRNCYLNWERFIFKSKKFQKQLKKDSIFWKFTTPEEMIYNKGKTRLSFNPYVLPGRWAYLKTRAKLSWYSSWTIEIIKKYLKW